LIEHSDVISQYDPDWPSLYERDRARIHGQCPNVDGIQIDIIFPTRSNRATRDNERVAWWMNYLEACGGYMNSVTRITGTP